MSTNNSQIKGLIEKPGVFAFPKKKFKMHIGLQYIFIIILLPFSPDFHHKMCKTINLLRYKIYKVCRIPAPNME